MLTLAEQWHAMSDHAANGTPFGAGLCNCEKLSGRVGALVSSALQDVSEEVHRTLWSIGDKATRRKSHSAGVAWRSAANATVVILRKHADKYLPRERP